MAAKQEMKKARSAPVRQPQAPARRVEKRPKRGEQAVPRQESPLASPAKETSLPADQPAAAAAPERPTATAPGETEVVLVYCSEIPAQHVSVAGDFNGWNPEAHPMKRISQTTYAIRFKLPPGEYQYKLVVDGTWVEDPSAKRQVPNGHGSRNSILLV